MTPTGRATELDRTTARAVLGMRALPQPGSPSAHLVDRVAQALATERLRGWQDARQEPRR